jgi:hypothetical protein
MYKTMKLINEEGGRLQYLGTQYRPTNNLKKIFWDITPCSTLKANRRFGATYSLHLQGRRISRATNEGERRWQAKPEDITLY